MNTINFNDYAIKLSKGQHNHPSEGMCIMECVAYIQGELHSDRPKCADPILTYFAHRLNDAANDEQRQKLIPFVLRLAGSKGINEPELQKQRLIMIANFVISTGLSLSVGRGLAKLLTEGVKEVTDYNTAWEAFKTLKYNSDKWSKAFLQSVSGEVSWVITIMSTIADGLYCLKRTNYLSSNHSAMTHLAHRLVKILCKKSTVSKIVFPPIEITDHNFEALCGLMDKFLQLTDAVPSEPAIPKLEKLVEITA